MDDLKKTTITRDDLVRMYRYINDDVVTEDRQITEEDLRHVRVWFDRHIRLHLDDSSVAAALRGD